MSRSEFDPEPRRISSPTAEHCDISKLLTDDTGADLTETEAIVTAARTKLRSDQAVPEKPED